MNEQTSKTRFKHHARLTPAYFFLLLWLAFCLMTIGWIFAASLSTTREIFTNQLLETGLHFENYINMWTQNNISRYFINSIIYSFASCVGLILIAAPAAYVLGRKIFCGSKTLINIFLIAMSVPLVMIVIPMYSILSRAGMTNKMITLIIMYISAYVPFTVFFLIGFFASLPGDLEEAAVIDGCSQGRVLWQIYMPLAQPAIITVTVFNFMNIWNEYFIALIYSTKTEIRPLSVGLQSIIQSMRYTGNWAGLFAAVVIVFLPTFLIYILISDKIISGVTSGAIKG